ncbi:hypothetical protein [Desulfovibrio sp.]|uniref:hypothetical protein n=1 Tax=Desulfovibrio sp. TaxID=885 RepID=UPI0026233455|nr:hypothetical protein [Desulfovibrio sp.]
MQTMYTYSAQHVPVRDNVVDFTAYRRRMARLTKTGSQAQPRPLREPPVRRRRSRRRVGWSLDDCASLALLVMAAAAVARFVLF